MTKKKEQSYDAYMVLVPTGVRLINIYDIHCSDREAYIISSPKNFGKIEFSLQGEKIYREEK